MRNLTWPFVGVLVAIAITSTMDATGLTVFSALPLFPLAALFWYLQRLPRTAVGLSWGRWGDYGLAALYPLIVLSAATGIAFLAGHTHTAGTDWGKAGLNFSINEGGTIVVAILTEEGFFRGWLWGSLDRAGVTRTRIVIWSSIAFALWHVSEVTLAKGYTLPLAQVPIFIFTAALLGVIWGLMRLISRSVIVASVSHGLWDGGAYTLFGVGARVGSLGVTDKATYGVEVGIVGLLLNLAFAIGLWLWWTSKSARSRQQA